MADHAEFLSRYPRRAGKLAAFQSDIVKLRKDGASYRMVCAFLAEQGVKADPGEVRRFMNRCGRQRLIAGTSPPSPAEKASAPKATGGLPKFEWNPDKSKDSSW